MKATLYILYLLFIFSLLSCESFVQVDVPPNELSTSNTYKDQASVEAVFAGIYSSLSNSTHRLSAEMQIGLALNSDELIYSGSAQNYNQFLNSSIQTDNSTIRDTWMNTYNSIYTVNAAIEGLLASVDLEDVLKSRYIGEAKFLRAFFYFYLVNLYGEVPLLTGTDYEINSTLGRSSVDLLYQQIVSDLLESKALLPKDYLNPERTRPSYYAACSLLAKVFLYLEDYQNAEIESSHVIDEGRFELSKLELTFKKESKETIWQLMPVFPNYNTSMGRFLIPTSLTNNTMPSYYFNGEFVEGFQTDDGRVLNWLGYKTLSDKSYFFPYKYQVQRNSILTEYLIIFRLAELYLIRAEARGKQDKFNGAREDLNMIRLRAGLDQLPDLNNHDLITMIMLERKRELFCEWGNRWFDLKRWGILDDIIGPMKGIEWNLTDAVWPIPLSEMESNPLLNQNPGY